MNAAEIFRQAELALASYAKNLVSGLSPSILDLQDGGNGMSQRQAEAFAGSWMVIDQFNDFSTGASATVLQQVVNGQPTGSKYLAIRGTQLELGDIVSDVILAIGVSARLNPQFDALKIKLDAWTADGGPLHGETFAVAGHSLGGYLAAALKQQFSQISAAYLFNAPGSGGLIGNIADLVGGVFGQSTPGAGGIWN
jgi:hypothetical protein